ncbi:MAG: hypothetical protein JOY84_07350 [Curvibacter sp.]|nr:hypothetical protein [Curvibacter sp.]
MRLRMGAWLLAWGSVVCAAAGAADLAVLQTHRLGGEGGWDYLSYDETGRRLFIARGSHVQVVDADSGSVVGDIPATPGVHGVALAADLGKAYASNGRDNSITVFSTGSLETLARIPTPAGLGPDFVAYDEDSHQVLAFNGKSHNLSIIDARNDRLVRMLALGGRPEAAVIDGGGRVFVELEDRNELLRLDLARAEVTGRWPLPGCDEPAGLGLDRAGRTLFVGCHNKTLLTVDADKGAVMDTLSIGEGVDATAFDPVHHQVFSAQADGTLTVLQPAADRHWAVQQTLTTRPGARTLALDPVRHRVYLVTAEFESTPTAPGQGGKKAKPSPRPGTFSLMVVGEAP